MPGAPQRPLNALQNEVRRELGQQAAQPRERAGQEQHAQEDQEHTGSLLDDRNPMVFEIPRQFGSMIAEVIQRLAKIALRQHDVLGAVFDRIEFHSHGIPHRFLLRLSM